MKKLFAIALAAAMIFSMASIAFADLSYWDYDYAFDYDEDGNSLWSTDNVFHYDDTAYFPLSDDTDPDFYNIAYSKLFENIKIKTSFEMGEELVESVKLVKINIGWDVPYYQYCIALKIADKETFSDADIIGTITIDRKAVKKNGVEISAKADEHDLDFNLCVLPEFNYIENEDNYLITGKNSSYSFEYDEAYALKFKCDEEVELEFGDKESGLNEGVFTVDVSGQGKIFLKWNTEPNEALAAANQGVDMHFVNFNDVKFNRAGEFVYEMEDGIAAYVIHDGVVTKMADCYDETEEAFVFRTNVLCNYVFANAELVIPA